MTDAELEMSRKIYIALNDLANAVIGCRLRGGFDFAPVNDALLKADEALNLTRSTFGK